MKWLVNGREGVGIKPEDRGFCYGDGLFETIALRNGRPRLLDRHLRRLAGGCERLGIPTPDARLIEAQIHEIAAGCERGIVKLILTRGPGPRGYGPPAALSPTLAVGFTPEHMSPGSAADRGASAILCKVPAGINPHFAGLKTLNRLENVMARAECQARGAEEGFMCTPGGRVIGGTMSNLFMVTRETLVTPLLDEAGILGIMRSVVLEVSAGLGLRVAERRVSVQDLMSADELFITNSLIGLQPVHRIEGRSLEKGQVTQSLLTRLASSGIEEFRT